MTPQQRARAAWVQEMRSLSDSDLCQACGVEWERHGEESCAVEPLAESN